MCMSPIDTLVIFRHVLTGEEILYFGLDSGKVASGRLAAKLSRIFCHCTCNIKVSAKTTGLDDSRTADFYKLLHLRISLFTTSP